MVPSSSSHQHGPPLLGRVRRAWPFPDVIAPMQPSDSLPPSATAPVPLAGGLPRCGRLFCALVGRRHVCPHTCRASETGHRLSATPGFVEERRGPPRLRDRPLRACYGRTPRRIQPPPCPIYRRGLLLPSMQSSTLGIREDDRFRGRSPTARTFACLRIADPVSKNGARLATGSGGLTLSRAGFAPAGR